MAHTPSAFDRPMRWAQIAFVEDDPQHYDPEFWIDFLTRTHCEGVCLSAGGCVAFYPTDIPLHHRSRFLGSKDIFGEMARRCRERGMVVIARTDPHGARQDVVDAHPDWVRRDAKGQLVPHWSHPDYFITCPLGPYNFEFMTQIHQEILKRYDVDGIFINRWDNDGICYCEHCRRNFHAATGHDLPAARSFTDPAWGPYLQWREARQFELWRHWRDAGEQASPRAGGAAVFPNAGGGALSFLDMAAVGDLAPALMADRQGRGGLCLHWNAGKNGKEYRAALGNKPVISLFSVGFEVNHRWKDSVNSEPELRLWMLDGICQGMRPWFCKFSATLHDRRWLKPVEDIYRWHHANEQYLRHTKNLARVALVSSQQTARYYGGEDAGRRVGDPIMGMYQALVEARIPFEMVHDRLLDHERLSSYKLLILPNVACLSDCQCDQLRAFVHGGGSLLATYETSLYDELGRRRSDFGLSDLLGISYVAHQPYFKNGYLRLNHSRGPHELLAGLEDAPRIINGTERLEVKMNVPFPDRPLTLIPAYPDLPMEEVYPRGERSDSPELFLRQASEGRGRVASFNWNIDRIFWDVLCDDHRKLLGNTIRWALVEPPVAEVRGGGLFDMAVWQQERSITLHLVNLTNAMAMKGPCRELLHSPPQQIRLRLPAGTRARGVKLLVSGADPRAAITDSDVALNLPGILDHEVVAVDLA